MGRSSIVEVASPATRPLLRLAARPVRGGPWARGVMPHPERLGRGFPLVSGLVAMRFY